MKPSEFVAERRRATQPHDPSVGGHTGGLVPTDHIDFEDDVKFLEPPKRTPERGRRVPLRRGVVPQQVDSGEQQPPPAEELAAEELEVNADTGGDDPDADRMLLRLRVLNTFGSPLVNCFVGVEQDGCAAGAFTGDNGVAELLIVRPVRTEKGEKQSQEIADNAEGQLQAPPPPAPSKSRTPHVNVQVSRGEDLLKHTRLYFQDVPENANDAHWNGRRIIQETGADFASFDVIVDTGEQRP